MSLGRPDLYIAGNKMQTAKTDPRPALAGLSIKWGTDNQFDYENPATLSGQLLVKGALPDYLQAGAPVGLVDPWSTRSLFAGNLQPLTAELDPAIAGAYRISFTATAPLSELQEHTLTEVDWPGEESAEARMQRLRLGLPPGWELNGEIRWPWLPQGTQRYNTIKWLDLADRYFRGNLQRMHDVSVYIPGAGLKKRLLVTPERPRAARLPADRAGTEGFWHDLVPVGPGGTAVLPAGVIARDGLQWQKTPEDVITAVQLSTWGAALLGSNDADESSEWEWPYNWQQDNTANIRDYGLRLMRIETALTPQNLAATMEAVKAITANWLDARSAWRPTTLSLPDSRRLGSAVLLNLLSTHSRGMAAVNVPAATGLPGAIRAYVLGGSAVWDGNKWSTEINLGRTQN